MTTAMQENQILAAQISIPYSGPEKTHTIVVGKNELRQVHTLLCY